MKGSFSHTLMNRLLLCALVFPFLLASSPASPSISPETVVRAVLFYSPNCGHCHLVITETFPPLFEKYGEQLVIVGVDISQLDGQVLFMAVLEHFNLESGGVPFLVIGDTYLVGSVDIPEKFPFLIDQHLAQGGIDWPAIPGLAEAMVSAQPAEAAPPVEPTSTNAAASLTKTEHSPTPMPGMLMTGDQSNFQAKFNRDLAGNSLAVIVLVAMILSVGGSIIFLRRVPGIIPGPTASSRWRDWLIPVLCSFGLVVAGYLAYVETAQVEAVCGPVGDCNTVQQSAYARLFGILPIGVLGVMGYVLILLAWGLGNSTDRKLAAYARIALLGFTVFGVLFSIYLTFLEPFVIGATCVWCLTSAVIVTALFWLSLEPARTTLCHIVTESPKKGDNQPVPKR